MSALQRWGKAEDKKRGVRTVFGEGVQKLLHTEENCAGCALHVKLEILLFGVDCGRAGDEGTSVGGTTTKSGSLRPHALGLVH